MKEPKWPDMGKSPQSEERFRENLKLLHESASVVCKKFAFFGDREDPGTAGMIALLATVVQRVENLQKSAPEHSAEGEK